MNRVKLWLYLAVLLCAGAANLVGLSRWLTHRAVAQLDRELTRAVAQVDARSQLLAMEAAQLADAVARDPAVLQGLSAEGEGQASSAAQSVVQNARGAAADSARSQLVATAGHGWRTFTVNGAPVQSDPQLDSLVSGAAVDAARREGYAVVGDALYYLVATPAGRGTAVAVGVPVSATWLAQLRASTGSDVTLLLDQRPPRGTLPPQRAAAVANAVRGATGPVDVGTLPPQPVALGVGIPVPALPLLFASAPEYRAHLVALRGLTGGALALSQPTSALLAPVVGYGWVLLAGLLVLFLMGVGTALSITNEQKTVIPKDLLAAADRITKRDFTARAPIMAGSLGTVAAALNCAAEAARNAGVADADPFAQFSMPQHGAQDSAAARQPPAKDVPAAQEAPVAQDVPREQGMAHGTAAAQEPLLAQEATATRAQAEALDFAAAQGSAMAQETMPTKEAPAEQDGPAFPWQLDAAPAQEPHASSVATAQEVVAASEPGAAFAAPSAEGMGWADASPPARPGEQLAATAQDPEPASAPELGSLASFLAAPENGAALRVREPASSVFEPPANMLAGASPAATQPDLLEAAAPATEPQPELTPVPAVSRPAAPAPVSVGDGDEEHWRVTYDDFLKVREQCGESRQGVSYERFRQKLQKNRDQLVVKYGCRTVRFQVYVKEGRAALKATPVR